MKTQQESATSPGFVLSPGMLRAGLQRSEFVVHYQPTVRFKDGRIEGTEALIRWRRPGFGMLPPGEFIPEAEGNGFINELGEFVLREACTQTRRWQRLFPSRPRLSVAVNVSARQLSEPGHASMVGQILRETGLDPHDLVLEVTESLIVNEASGALEQLEELFALGVRISIDDFGTGYSSLSRIHNLPVSRLKIDQSFVARLTNSEQARPLVTATIDMAHGLGMRTTAEGIETRAQWTYLRRNGVDEGQGYLLSRPVDAATLEALLRARQALIRPGVSPLAIPLMRGKVAGRTSAALIAAGVASGWVGASAAPGGAVLVQHVAISASASAASLTAGLPFVSQHSRSGPALHAGVLAAHSTAPSGQAVLHPGASHPTGSAGKSPGSAGKNPNPAGGQPPPGQASTEATGHGHQNNGNGGNSGHPATPDPTPTADTSQK